MTDLAYFIGRIINLLFLGPYLLYSDEIFQIMVICIAVPADIKLSVIELFEYHELIQIVLVFTVTC